MSKQTAAKQPENHEIEELKEQVSLLTEALQRERADATNIRRQHEDQLGSLRTLVKSGVVRDLLPVIDNFERALKHEPLSTQDQVHGASEKKDENHKLALERIKKYEEYAAGVRGLVKQFEKTLNDIGVTRIKTVGEPFDPKYHEAVSMEEGEGKQEVVSEELQAGYMVGDDVIRHAMVRVRLS